MIKYLLILLAIPQIAFAGAQYLLGDASEPAAENSLNCSYAAPASTVTLNNDDWKQYAETLAADVNEKASTEILPNYTLTNGGSVIRGSGIGVTYSWTGGTPTASGSAATYAYFSGSNLGFEWTIPATASEGTLKVYTRTYNGTNRFTVTLPGCTTYTADHTRTNSGENRVYTIAFSGQGNLVVRMELVGTGVMGVQAVTIDREEAPPDVTLTGSSEEIPAQSNLTTIGTTDWKMYGRSSVTDVDEMDGGTAIPDYTRIGSSTLVRNASTPKFSWSNGKPTATGTDITSRIVSPGDQTGFQWEIQAVEATRIVSVYVRGYKARIKFSASMAGAEPYIEYLDTPLTGTGRVFRVSFSGTGTLTIRWETDGIETGGDCSLSAITLSTAGDEDPYIPPPPPEDSIFVRKTGSDSTGDGTGDKPYLTIPKALSVSTSGDTVVIGDGSYGYSTTLTVPAGVSMTSESLDYTKVRLYPTANLGLSTPVLSLSDATVNGTGDQSISYIEFDGLDGSYKASRVFQVQNRNDVTIDNCYFHDFYTTPNIAGTMTEQTEYSMIVKSTQINDTAGWAYYWPPDSEAPGDDSEIDSGIQGNPIVYPATPTTSYSVKYAWPTNPVQNFVFSNNRVIDCFPLHPLNLKNSQFTGNYVNNLGTCIHWLKGTCAFLWNVDVTDNEVYGEPAPDTSSAQSSWRIELWVMRGGCEFKRNIMDGWYSITVGKETIIADNVLIKPSSDTNYQTAIEFNSQSYGVVSGNFISGAGGYGVRFASNGASAKNWIYEYVTVKNNAIFNAKYTPIQVEGKGAVYDATSTIVRNMYVYNNAIEGASPRTTYGLNIKNEDNLGICTLSNIYMVNNIVKGVSGWAASTSGSRLSNIYWKNNTFTGCTNNSLTGTGTVTDTLITDPLWVNPGTDFAGYALGAESPAINSATATIASGVTITGYSGAAPDRGAIEYEE